jgi:hypothetical protein
MKLVEGDFEKSLTRESPRPRDVPVIWIVVIALDTGVGCYGV